MNQVERKILDDLRETTLKSLTKLEFETIEKAFINHGILNLSGVMRNVIFSSVAKYNANHDEKGKFSSSDSGSVSSPKGDGRGDNNQKAMDYMDQLHSTPPAQLTAQQKMDLARMVRHYVINPAQRGIIGSHTFQNWRPASQRGVPA